MHTKLNHGFAFYFIIIFWSGCVHTKLSVLDNGKITGLIYLLACATLHFDSIYKL